MVDGNYKHKYNTLKEAKEMAETLAKRHLDRQYVVFKSIYACTTEEPRIKEITITNIEEVTKDD